MWVQEAFNKAKVGQDCVVMLNGEILYRFKKTSGMILHGLMSQLCINALTRDNWKIIKEKKTGWINIYNNETYKAPGCTIHETKEIAFTARGGSGNYIDTIKIEWEE